MPSEPSEATEQALKALTMLVRYAQAHPRNRLLDSLRPVALYTVYRPGRAALTTVNIRGLEAATNEPQLDELFRGLAPRLPTTVRWPSDGLQKLRQLRAAALPA